MDDGLVVDKQLGPKDLFIQQPGDDLPINLYDNVDDLLSHLVFRQPVHLSWRSSRYLMAGLIIAPRMPPESSLTYSNSLTECPAAHRRQQ